MCRMLLLTIAALAMTGCKTTEIVVAHQESGISVTTRFDTSEMMLPSPAATVAGAAQPALVGK